MRALLLSLGLVPALVFASNATPGEAVASLWQALSHAPDTSGDARALGQLFHTDAVVFGSRYQQQQPIFSVTKAADFVSAQARVRPAGFYECEVAREVKVYDRFATVYSVVESRSEKSQPTANFVGVNSIQLYNDGTGWKILSLYYQVEKTGLPVSLDDGKPGVCLTAG